MFLDMTARNDYRGGFGLGWVYRAGRVAQSGGGGQGGGLSTPRYQRIGLAGGMNLGIMRVRSGSGDAVVPPDASNLLLESGDDLLREDGGLILTEN